MEVDVMISKLTAVKSGIAGSFTSIDKGISTAAKKLSGIDLKSDDARKILQNLGNGRPYMVDVAIIDKKGKIVQVEPAAYQKYEGSDVSAQEHNIALARDKKPVLSGVFRTLEGTDAVDFAYPIISASGAYLGSVSMLVKQDALTGNVIVPIVAELPFKVWIMQKDGLIIYDADSAQIGKYVFSDVSFRPFNQLISFSRTVAMAKDGGGSYDFYDNGLTDKTVVKKYAVWDTVSLYGTEWRIISMKAMPAEKKGEDKK